MSIPQGASNRMLSGMVGPATGSMMISTPRSLVSCLTRSPTFSLWVDDMVGSEAANEPRLFLAADNANHVETCHLGKIDQRIAHPARSGINEHALPRLRSHRMVEHVV